MSFDEMIKNYDLSVTFSTNFEIIELTIDRIKLIH